jgi:hypothetical protein
LPGLILEVNDGDTTILCSSITLNPKDDVIIYEPKKGSKVSQVEYNKIMLKKSKEMNEQFRSKSSDSESGNITIEYIEQ